MAAMCRDGRAGARPPGLRLGAALGELARAGRDKVTFFAVAVDRLASAPGLEQLVAESTGKEGTGLLPVDGETPGSPAAYGDDRVSSTCASKASPTSAPPRRWRRRSKRPVSRPDASTLADVWDMGAEFLRWEIAVAAAGAVLGIDPFDQPNVQESKDNTRRLLRAYAGDALCRRGRRVRRPAAVGRGRRRGACRAGPAASCWSPFGRATTWPCRPTCRRPSPSSASCRACACSCATAFAWPRRSATARASCTRPGSSTRAAKPSGVFLQLTCGQEPRPPRSRGSRTPSGSSKPPRRAATSRRCRRAVCACCRSTSDPTRCRGSASFGGLVAELLRS